jgi:integrase
MILQYRKKRLGRGTSELTTNRETALLKKMFSFAIEKGLATNNPAKKIKMFSESNTARTRVLSVEEEQRLFVELASHIRPIVLTALNTGLRYSEIVGLKWNDIDMEQGKIKVEHTKSGKVRFVPINSVLRSDLERLSVGKKQVGRVFRSKSIRKGFENACRRAGIEGFVFHDLRRTFGTRLLERGVDIVTISRLYGHSSVLVTQRYLHPQDEIGREAVERLTISATVSHICPTASKEESPTLPVN